MLEVRCFPRQKVPECIAGGLDSAPSQPVCLEQQLPTGRDMSQPRAVESSQQCFLASKAWLAGQPEEASGLPRAGRAALPVSMPLSPGTLHPGAMAIATARLTPRG